MFPSNTTTLNGVQIHYIETGQAEPALVILHGITGSHTSFLHLIPALAQQAHVYALDLRGHFQSSHVPGTYQLADYGRDVVAFLQSVVQQPVILAGHSLGGMVALWAAAHAPEWVLGVFLEEPSLFIFEPPRLQGSRFYSLFTVLRQQLRQYHDSGGALEYMVAVLGQFPANAEQTMLEAVGPEQVHQQAMELHQMDPTVLDHAIDGLILGSEDPDTILRQVRCPAALLAGQVEFGGALSAGDVQRFRLGLASCSATVIEGAGHLIHREQPAAYLHALQRFVDEVKRLPDIK